MHSQATMLSKDSLFKVVRGVLRSKSVRSFEEFQDAFDHHLQQSLTVVKASLPDTPRAESNILGDHTYMTNGVLRCNGNEKEDYKSDFQISRGIGVDGLKPFEIVMGFQLLASQCNPTDQIGQSVMKCPKFNGRLHSLLCLAWFHMDELSFVKLSLILNSLTNIIRSGSLRIDVKSLIEDKTGGDPRPPSNTRYGKNNGEEWLINDTNHKCFNVALKEFVKAVNSRLMLALWLNTRAMEKSVQIDDTIGCIDMHSICMILKYYATVPTITVEMLYLIYEWLQRQSQLHLRDKITMVVHLSKLTNRSLFERHDVISLNDIASNFVKISVTNTKASQNLRRHVGDMLCSDPGHTESPQPEIVIESLLKTLIEKDTVGSVNMQMMQLYMGAIAQLRLKNIGPQVIGKALLGAINDLSFLISTSGTHMMYDFKEYASILRNIKLCMSDMEVFYLTAVHRFFFSEDVQRAILASILRMVKEPNAVSIRSLSDFCSFVTSMDLDSTLNVNYKATLERLKETLRKTVPLCYQSVKDEISIRDIINTYTYLRGNRNAEMDAQKRFLRLYFDLSTSLQTADLVKAYSDTTELFHSMHKTKYTLEHSVHTQISSFLSATHVTFWPQNSTLYLKLLQMLSRVCKSDTELLEIYDCLSMWHHVFKFEGWKENVMVLVDVAYNLLLHNGPGPSKGCDTKCLEPLLEHYYEVVISPIITSKRLKDKEMVYPPSDCSSPFDVSMFAKYILIVWNFKGTSEHLGDLWSRLSTVITNDMYLFSNRNNESFGRTTAPPYIHHGNKVLRSQRWQAFSVLAVVDILVKLHRNRLSNDNVYTGQLTKEQQTISLLLDLLMEGLDVFDDNASSLSQLLRFCSTNMDCLESCPNLQEALCKIQTKIELQSM